MHLLSVILGVNKELLEALVKQGLSTTDIAKKIGLGQTTARYWLKKFGLKTEWYGNLDNKYKFSNEHILEIWKDSDSINQFLLKLGVGHSGGSWYHYKKRLKNLGVIFSETNTLDGRKRGGLTTAALRNRKAVLKRQRLPRPTLKKLMDLNKIEEECSTCGVSMWLGKKLKLHIHHKDGNCKNNNLENLCYSCPNCHNIEHYDEFGRQIKGCQTNLVKVAD